MGDVKSCIDTIMQCTLDFRAKLLAASLDNNDIRISISDELYSKVRASSYIVRATLHYGQGPTIKLWDPLKRIQRPYHGKLKLYYVQSWAFKCSVKTQATCLSTVLYYINILLMLVLYFPFTQ